MRRHVEAVEPRLHLSTYYVSPDGDDAAAGISAAAPWRTVARVNALDLEPGDQVLFQGGRAFDLAAAPNLVNDGGFESGTLTSWDEDLLGASITSTPADVHSGNHALRVDGVGGRGQILTTRLRPSTPYLVKFWAKASAANVNAFAGVTFQNVAVEVQLTSFPIANTQYKLFTAQFISPAVFDYCDVWVDKTAASGTVFIDDVSVVEANSLLFDAADSGTPANPVVVGSYGAGRATILSGDASGVLAHNVAGFELRDLDFAGTWNANTGAGPNIGDGVSFTSALPGGVKLQHLRVENVSVHGYKLSGLTLRSGDASKSGFGNVRFTGVDAHDNGDYGISVFGWFDANSYDYAHEDVSIAWCRAWNNTGIADKGQHSGSGILLSDTDGGVIERCVAWNNGKFCNYSGGGPIGIWAWDANAITIQFNESYANQTGSASLDGGGLDLDGGVTNSVIQYNYTHDNAGAGILLWQHPGARAFNNNVVRYNISQNDARDNDYAGIYIGGGSDVTNTHVYGNTIYMSPSGKGTVSAIQINGVGSGNRFRNNVLYATGGTRLIDSNAAYATSSVLFQGNNYFTAGGAFAIRWNSTTYNSLSSWRTATQQERLGGVDVGTTGDPKFVAPGAGGTVGDPALLHLMLAYQTKPGSAAIDGGVNLASLGVSAGPRDFYGAAPGYGAGYDAGAFEWRDRTSGTSAGDAFRIRPGPAGSTEVFVNAPASPIPTYAFAAGVYSSFTFEGLAGNDVLDFDAPTGVDVKFNAGSASGVDTLNVNAGSFAVNATRLVGSDVAVNVAGGAIATFADGTKLAALNIAGIGILAGGLYTRSIDLTGDGRLDADDGYLIVDYAGASPLPDISADVISALNGGAWDGPGITSSAAAATGPLVSLGIAEAAAILGLDGGATDLFGGFTVDATTVLLKYTYAGDANLDGTVNADDYANISFFDPDPSAAGYYNGDFNFDGEINADDFALIDFVFNAQGAPL